MKLETIVILVATVLSTFSSYAGEINSVVIITTHNRWRAEVGVTEKLSYSPTLATAAQVWVDKLARTNNCQMRHSKPDGQYGENLYWASAVTWSDGRKELQKVSSKHVINNWGSEKANYDYTSNQCTQGEMCGHYTQMIWRTTTKVGCGMAVCADSKEQIWACQYKPAGNWVGKRPY